MKTNKVTIRIGENKNPISNMPLDKALEFCCYLRTARKVGDVETVNHTQLGRLIENHIEFERL